MNIDILEGCRSNYVKRPLKGYRVQFPMRNILSSGRHQQFTTIDLRERIEIVIEVI